MFSEHKDSRNRKPVFSGGPLWELDVGALGYGRDRINREVGYLPSAGPICFPSQSQVVVTFVTNQPPGPLSRRGESDAYLPYLLHALFIDTKDGHLEGMREWASASSVARVLPAPGGNFIVVTPDRLILFSQGLDRIKELALPIAREAITNSWEFESSPKGKYILLKYEPLTDDKEGNTFLNARSHDQFVDVDTLQTVKAWTDMGVSSPNWESVSDNGLALADGGKLGEPGGHLDWFCPPGKEYCRNSDRFLDDQTIFAWAHTRNPSSESMHFLSNKGELLFSEIPPKGDHFEQAFSADGRRLALGVFKASGGVTALDVASHYSLSRIVVYDIPARKWVYSLEAKKLRIKARPARWRDSELALTSDGSLLGLITNDGMLQVYRLPSRRK